MTLPIMQTESAQSTLEQLQIMIGFVLFSFLIFSAQTFNFCFFIATPVTVKNRLHLIRFCGILNKRGMIKLNFNLYIYFISPYKTGNNMMQGLQQFSNKILNIYV